MPSNTTSDHRVRSLYISSILDLPPLAAQSAVDALRLSFGGTSTATQGGLWSVRTTSGHLILRGPVCVAPSEALTAFRRWQGVLRLRRLGLPVAVEVELGPWSATRCEIGLRPSGRLVPGFESRRQRLYLIAGTEALALLASDLERRAWGDVMAANGAVPADDGYMAARS